ncbi:MAG: creatininase family protein [Trueperaceae bacterium]|nr:MAG: creatininase family protein [Trueperaceae bacterium]
MTDQERVASEYRYEKLTWPDINEAVAQQKAIILPVGSVEQHGYHLPQDVDVKLASSIAVEAGRRCPEEILVMPPVSYGYTHHVTDFPGTINIEPTTFVRLLLDIARSVAYHGFKRIIILNGHGSNHPLVEQAGRQATLQTDALCLTLSWWQLVADYWNSEVRTSVVPGGCAHACELETSMYMHLDGDLVREDRIVGDLPDYMKLPDGDKWQYVDLTAGSGPATIVEWTSSYSESGSFGEPQKATRDKGAKAFEHATSELIALIKWFRRRPSLPRKLRHDTPPTFELPFGF